MQLPAVLERYRGAPPHPERSAPLAIRISEWRLRRVIGTYVLLVVGWILVVSLVLLVDDRGEHGVVEPVRRALQAMWGPDSLFDSPGRSLLYYVLAMVNALVSVLLPVFLLGAFVFKLFSHDPLRWRKALTLEAHPSGYFVLTARFYNRFTVDLADVKVRAWLKWVPPDAPTVHRNQALELLIRGQHECEFVWPIASPAEPTTFRIVLGPTSGAGSPVDEGSIRIQGQVAQRSKADILIIVEGVMLSTNEQFRSRHSYSLATDVELDGTYQDIGLGAGRQRDWKRFDETQDVYLFVYGSLMRSPDLAAAGLDPAEARAATLEGWQRLWNVASNPARKGRQHRHLDGREFTGRIVSLGLAEEEGAQVRGVVVRVDPSHLAAFDVREQDYDRTDVSACVSWPERDVARPPRVFTYVPKPEAVAEFEARRDDGSLVITASYFESVRDAASQIEGTADGVGGIDELRGARVEELPQSHHVPSG